MQVWNVLHAACWKYRTQKSPKSRHLRTIVQLCRAIYASTIGKNLLSSNTSSTYPGNMVNFGPLAAEIDPVVWSTPANFSGFRVLAALLHGSQVLGVNQTLRRWTEGATYIRQGGHHVGHWPTFLVSVCLSNVTLVLLVYCDIQVCCVNYWFIDLFIVRSVIFSSTTGQWTGTYDGNQINMRWNRNSELDFDYLHCV